MLMQSACQSACDCQTSCSAHSTHACLVDMHPSRSLAAVLACTCVSGTCCDCLRTALLVLVPSFVCGVQSTPAAAVAPDVWVVFPVASQRKALISPAAAGKCHVYLRPALHRQRIGLRRAPGRGRRGPSLPQCRGEAGRGAAAGRLPPSGDRGPLRPAEERAGQGGRAHLRHPVPRRR